MLGQSQQRDLLFSIMVIYTMILVCISLTRMARMVQCVEMARAVR